MGIMNASEELGIERKIREDGEKKQAQQNQSFEHRIGTITAEKRRLESTVVNMQQQIDALTAVIESMGADLQHHMGTTEERFSRVNSRVDDNDDSLVDIESALDKVEFKVYNMKDDIDGLSDLNDENRQQINNLHTDYSMIGNGQNRLEKDMRNLAEVAKQKNLTLNEFLNTLGEHERYHGESQDRLDMIEDWMNFVDPYIRSKGDDR